MPLVPRVAAGPSGRASPRSARCSSSKRRMMCRLYVVSSASTRMSPGSARLTAARNASRSTSPSCAGNVSCSGSYQCSQNGRLRPTRFSQVRLCDSFSAERRRAGERRALERLARCRARSGRGPPRASSTRADVEAGSRSASSCARRGARTRCRTGARSDRGGTSPPSNPSVARIRPQNAFCASAGKGCVEERRVDVRCARARARVEHRPDRPEHLARPRSSSCTARSRRGAACTASPPTRSTRRSGASARGCARARGRNFAKSFVARASIQTWLPSAAARISSARSSVGTRRCLLPVAARDADQARVVGLVRRATPRAGAVARAGARSRRR